MICCLKLLSYVLLNFFSSFSICRIFPHMLEICPYIMLTTVSFRIIIFEWERPVIIRICHITLLQCSSKFTFNWEYMNIFIKGGCYDYRLISYIYILNWSNYILMCCPLWNLDNLWFIYYCCTSSYLWVILLNNSIPTSLIILLTPSITLLLPHVNFTVRHTIFVYLLIFNWLSYCLAQYCRNILNSYISHFITNNKQKLSIVKCIYCSNRAIFLQCEGIAPTQQTGACFLMRPCEPNIQLPTNVRRY